jgi:predicted transcriptional regulator
VKRPDRINTALNTPCLMTAKELVINALKKLPEETSLAEILEEIDILAAIQRGEEAADAGRVVAHEDVKGMVASWATK